MITYQTPGSSVFAQAFRGAWAPSTAYVPGDIVTYLGRTYMAPSAFTSGASFNVANWTLLAGRGQARVDYAESTGPDLVLAITSGAFQDITGVTSTKTYDGVTPIKIGGFISQVNQANAAAQIVTVRIADESNAEVGAAVMTIPGVAGGHIRAVSRTFTPTAGSHTYKLQATINATENLTIKMSATRPAFIEIDEAI